MSEIVITNRAIAPLTPLSNKVGIYSIGNILFTIDSEGVVRQVTSNVVNTVEVNIGTKPKKNGRFIITSPCPVIVGKPVMISQANGPYTGKGARSDEAEMDHMSVSGKVTSASIIECFWSSPTKVWKNFKFDYMVSS